ncbi:FKBP-type peptidyl-prolyl cis-trans isomerase [Lentzea flaviverrucosa]|uniref:Peptidyl-prolyl cis-trans isomerase n=1 Tax=Lentzea flaviverrucosa TaxID=200379 RepID=A0A1H9T2H9_9PSEU|nr:FKBP-type peptidyl-prolyl cis-trans isomerase [Lentzea flaviverrucosa]RDI25616.1 peptidylprolyl isomerase [Lentzea flaviverrucosa]SER91277.1 peptidylprolyl isomerase [Lentzea flaviverrucosa]
MRNVLLIASVALAATGLAGCAGSAQPSAGGSSPAAAAPTNPCKADDFKVTGDFGAAPKVEIPNCKPTSELVIKDLVVGTGAEVKTGSTATVNYQLTTFSDKKVLDSSFQRGAPFDVENVGQAQVIDGWNEGIVGLKEKGRRLLIVPPAKGYGKGGQGIKANETLVFVIDGVKVTPAA